MGTETQRTLKPGDPEYGELIFSSRKFAVGGRFRVNGRRFFVAANHNRNGELISEVFSDVWEQRRSDDNVWDLVESGEEKALAFCDSVRVVNARTIPDASTHEQAIAIAREQFCMGPIASLGVRQ